MTKKKTEVEIGAHYPNGELVVRLDGKTYRYKDISPYMKKKLEKLLENNNLRKFFRILKLHIIPEVKEDTVTDE